METSLKNIFDVIDVLNLARVISSGDLTNHELSFLNLFQGDSQRHYFGERTESRL